MQIRVEKYRKADLSEMLAIWNEIVKEGLAFPQDTLESMESFDRFIANQSYCGIAREQASDKVVGLYILHPNNVGRCSHICNASYGVGRQQRGKGIGKAMVQDSLEKARELGFRTMQFNAVAADNEPANRLYNALGFKPLGTIPGGFRRENGYADINLYYYPFYETR